MMSIDAFRFLAQTTLPATQAAEDAAGPLPMLLLLAAILALPLTIQIIRRRQLHHGLMTLEPLQPPGKSDLVGLGVALLLGFALPIVVGGAIFHALGVQSLAAKTPATQRLAIMVQPAMQVASIVGVLGMLILTLPAGVRVIGLRFDRPVADLRQGISSYLLAVPWVLLVSVIVEVIVKRFGFKTSTEHEVFTLWRAEGPGLTSFKLVMFLGAVILAPVAEEIFFRGVLQTLLLRLCRVPAVAIIAVSVLFASRHDPWPLQPPIFVLSLALGWAYFRTRSLLPAIFIHIGFNAINFMLFLTAG